MEGTESTHNTKVSDSAYSNSCSNSQSQRSGSSKSRQSESSKSRQSGSSGSSGYGGKHSTEVNNETQHNVKRGKDKDRKKKKRSTGQCTSTLENDITTAVDVVAESGVLSTLEVQDENNTDTRDKKASETALENKQMTEALGGIPVLTSKVTDDQDNQDALNINVSLEAAENICSTQDQIKPDKIATEDGFCCVISMHDGVVLFTTSSLTESLGYPRDMLLGRSFIDFIHPKDRSTFASQITMGVAPISESKNGHKDTRSSLFVLLRKYRGLRTSGYGVTSKAVTYEPYRLTLTFREAPENQRLKNSDITSANTNILLVISATPVRSIYKDESICSNSKKFYIRHTASGVISYIDGQAVGLVGYLPQDLVGKNIMDYYHPEDLPLLKEVYETVMKKAHTGVSFFSKPYRFLTNNANWVALETEFTSFVNPWSKKLEFVIGHNRVLKGPKNINIFDKSSEPEQQFSEEVLAKRKSIQDDILNLLSEAVTRSSDTVKQVVSKRCQALASFMESLLDDINRKDLDVQIESDVTFSERDSVMLGEISPHHENWQDSKSSSETPPSYTQLNYNENLQRFFDSHPITTTENNHIENIETNEVRSGDARTNVSPVHGYGENDSGGNLSSGSNVHMESITNTSNTGTGTSSGSYQPPTLTQELLCKHNEDMEKNMIKRHKVSRLSGRLAEKVKKAPDKTIQHGVKRSGSHSWEGEAHKSSKHDHFTETRREQNIDTATNMAGKFNAQQACSRSIDPWPPFSVTTIQGSSLNNQINNRGFMPTVYYIPAPQTTNNIEQTKSTGYQTLQYMTGVLYPSFNVSQPHLMYQPVIYQPMPFQPLPTPSNVGTQPNTSMNFTPAVNDKILMPMCQSLTTQTTGNGTQIQNSFQRPPSQATSVKAEPGSNMGSIASIVNCRALSESPKRIVDDEECSDENKANAQNRAGEETNGTSDNMDKSSYSSFYSSFLRTEGSSTEERQDAENNSIKQKKELTKQITRPPPSWLEGISITSELIYRYQIAEKTVKDVLTSDMAMLKGINQPSLVNEQLDQLYLDLELEGLSARLSFGESSSSGSSGEEENSLKMRAKRFKYGRIVMIYEENAPLPPT
ncbi:period circadian protein isoform X2 [Culicoides brevitarsis]|uniref:period circadian protein isoform X2 n=1 Tax=Culicoides brevitarsis TaxID=469753 RepID=UPI00307C0B12